MAAAIVLFALARFGGLALGALDRFAHIADFLLFLGDLAFFGVAQAGVGQRVLARALFFRGQGLQHHAGGLGAEGLPDMPESLRAGRLAAGAAGVGTGAAVSTRGLPGARVLTFSTTTCLVRPWLKFWRTTLCSTPRDFSVNVLPELTLELLVASLFRRFRHSVPKSQRFQRDS